MEAKSPGRAEALFLSWSSTGNGSSFLNILARKRSNTTWANLTSVRKRSFLLRMTALAKGIYTLAFIALSMMQPTGVWFCTVTKSICATPSPECCVQQVHDCCENGTHAPGNEKPCCIEVEGEWQAVPSKALNVPEPSIADITFPSPAECFEAPSNGSCESWVFIGTDPPPLGSVSLDRLCVRLI